MALPGSQNPEKIENIPKQAPHRPDTLTSENHLEDLSPETALALGSAKELLQTPAEVPVLSRVLDRAKDALTALAAKSAFILQYQSEILSYFQSLASGSKEKFPRSIRAAALSAQPLDRDAIQALQRFATIAMARYEIENGTV